MSPVRPRSIEASKSRGEVVIVWEDDHVSHYPLVGLRQACPCAECRGGHEGMSVPLDPQVLRQPLAEGRSAELIALEAVGNYALLPSWADGHRFGIYTWEVLRRLCPCGEHAAGMTA